MNIAVIVANGRLDTSTFANFFNGDLHTLMAADGGANHLKALDIIPKEIIGDLDSLEDLAWWKEQTTVTHVPDQHSTDIEKCLDRVEANLYVIYGASGNRLDHTFEILHILKKYADKHVIFVHETDIIFALPTKWRISLATGTRLSLYPLKKTAAISSRGLKYSIDGIEFDQGSQIGTSNETTDEHVEMVLQNPGLACILPIEFLPTVINTLSS